MRVTVSGLPLTRVKVRGRHCPIWQIGLYRFRMEGLKGRGRPGLLSRGGCCVRVKRTEGGRLCVWCTVGYLAGYSKDRGEGEAGLVSEPCLEEEGEPPPT